MTEIVNSIPSRIKNAAINGHVCGTEDIIDDIKNKTQSEINAELEEQVNNSSDFIKLLNLTGTAPAQCVIGDKYYNTNSKKIFTAIDTNTWGDTGADPDTSRLYVNLNNNNTYRWNGTDMTPLGNPDVYTKSEVNGLIATERERAQNIENTKANTSDVYTKSQIDNNYYTVAEGEQLESNVQEAISTQNTNISNTLANQQTKIDTLDGHDVIVVDTVPVYGSAEANKIYRLKGTNSYTDYMKGSSQMEPIATYSFPGTDDKPTSESDNFVKSNGILKTIFDALPCVKEDIEPHGVNTGVSLLATGVYQTDENSNVIWYLVKPGDVLRLNLSKDNGTVFQFQNRVQLPANVTQANSFIVGTTHTNAIDSVVVVPEGAVVLAVSQYNNNTTNIVKICYNKADVDLTKDSKNTVSSGSVFDKTCVYIPGEEIVGTLITGMTPRQSNNTIISSANNLLYYPVFKGVRYLLQGMYYMIINVNNCGICFTENIPEVGMHTTTVIQLEYPMKYYNDIYVPSANGYICISTADTGLNLKVYKASVQGKADYFKNIERFGEVEDTYNNIYTGEPIVLPRILKNRCRIDSISSIQQLRYTCQGADIYDGIYYQFYYNGDGGNSDYIGFNIKNNPVTSQAPVELTIPEPYCKAHCGNIRFQRNPAPTGPLPLMWMSNLGVDGDYGWCALLVDLNTSPMTIKKYFNFTASIPFDEQGNPIEQPRLVAQGMLCIDPDGGRGWGIFRSSTFVDPITVVPFTFDDSIDGDITDTIVQGEAYQVKSLNCSIQDFFYAEDKVYIAAGNYSGADITTKIAVLDVNRKELVSIIETGIPYEAQGISIYDGNIYFSTMKSGGNNLFKITF